MPLSPHVTIGLRMPPTPPEVLNCDDVDAAIAGVPDRPAVFLVWPQLGEPYLGRTGLLRRRLRRLLGARGGAGRLLSLRGIAERVEYWPVASWLESTLVYYEVARRHFPDKYLKLIKLRMPPHVKILLGNTFPRMLVTTKLGGTSLYYGPFRTRAAAEQFEAEVLDLFQIRRCTEDLAPSTDHPGCIYGEMNMCLRPCQLAVGEEEYRSEVARVVEFLHTSGRSLTEPLSAARDRLSEDMDFEEAGRLHKRIEKIEQVARLRDELAGDVDKLYGVAITPSVDPGAVQLWFMARGYWLPGHRFGFEVPGGKAVSMDQRLRELVAALEPPQAQLRERQEHIALLARWYYSTWRDGEWLQFGSFEHAPYRKMVRAISRIVARAVKPPVS